MNMLRQNLVALLCASGGLLLSACSDGAEFGLGGAELGDEAVGEVQDELGVGSCNVNVEPLRSIMIVHPNIVDDARASNATNGVWSFRPMIENMAPTAGAADTDAFLRGIFESWTATQFVNGAKLELRSSDAAMDRFAIFGTAPRQFNLANAPFRLMAIASRLDPARCRHRSHGHQYPVVTRQPQPGRGCHLLGHRQERGLGRDSGRDRRGRALRDRWPARYLVGQQYRIAGARRLTHRDGQLGPVGLGNLGHERRDSSRGRVGRRRQSHRGREPQQQQGANEVLLSSFEH